MRVAIVHYWLVAMRGGERVLEALCEIYPQADIFTHVYSPDRVSDVINRHRIRTTFIARLPWAQRCYRSYLPLMPLALEQLDLRNYDLVISSESGPAKGVLTRPDAIHICYCHSPMRYIWSMYQDYSEGLSAFKRWGMALLAYDLRQWDLATAARVDHFVANSQNVAKRIRKYYRRDAVVVHPPVDLERFDPVASSEQGQQEYYMCVGQLVSYKRLDIAVEAFNRLGKPLIVIGEGPLRGELAKSAGPNIRFLDRVSDATLSETYAGCRAVVFTAEEDFGIVPLEAMASGKPVLAFSRGGALETVVPGRTGLFFDKQTPEAVIDAVLRFESSEGLFRQDVICAHARKFSKERFKLAFRSFVVDVIDEAKLRSTQEATALAA